MVKFIKWLFCLEPRRTEFPCVNNRMIMNRNGNISLNLDNPEVLKGIHKEMMKYKDLKLVNRNGQKTHP